MREAQQLREDAKNLRLTAERLEALASERITSATLEMNQNSMGVTDAAKTFEKPYTGMTQHNAVLKALQLHGPQTIAELQTRLSNGGMEIKKMAHFAPIISRLKKRGIIEKDSGGRIVLKADLTTTQTGVLTLSSLAKKNEDEI